MRNEGNSGLVLEYLETHVADHCNLKCKGCGHFSSVSDTHFADPAIVSRDFRRLAKLFRTISVIRLLGGEPLLHPELRRIIEEVRSCFPCARLCVVTNGLLLPAQPSSLWECCKKHNIVIQVTKYPIAADLGGAVEAAKRAGVTLEIGDQVMTFVRFLNPDGDSDPNAAFASCKKKVKAPFLKEGKVFPCALSANIDILNRRFDLSFPRSSRDFIELGDVVSGLEIIQFLGHCVPFCAWCFEHWPRFKWGISAMRKEEWIG